MPFCYSCGAPANERAVVCVKCGVALVPLQGTASFPAAGGTSDKEWLVTLLLCIFLGWLGVHRFYVGHVGVGVAQLLTAGGCGLWWFIDILLVALGAVRDAQGRPLRR